MERYTAELCEWVAKSREATFPTEVVDRTKQALLDGLGCALFGSTLPWSKRLHDSMARFGGGSGLTIGFGNTLTPDRSALVNGSLIQGFELDDYHQDAGIHVNSCVVPAALSAAEMRGNVSGQEFLVAVLLGFEVASRVGRCMNPSITSEAGWHTGAIFGPFGAAAAAGSILKLDAGQMGNAFGIAGTQASGLGAVQFGSMVKRMHHGRAAQSGLYGAVLAEDGYTGIQDVFEQPYGGYCSTFSRGETFNLEELTAELGTRFGLEGISLKPYSCNGGNHTTIDALHAIRSRTSLEASDVREIVVKMSNANREHVGWPYSSPSPVSAQMNLCFCAAAFVIQGEVFVDQFTEENVRLPELVDFASRVRTVHEPNFDELGTSLRHHVQVDVEFADGHIESQSEDFGRGSARRPLTGLEVSAKLAKLLDIADMSDRAAPLAALVNGLESQPSLGNLMRLLGAS